MSTTSTEPQKDPNSLNTGKVIRGATFLGLVVLAAIILSTIFIIEDRRSIPHADMPACERPASTDTGYSGTLPVDRWEYVGAAYVPVTPFGPSELDGDAPTCYEHSPAGAATAAVYIATLGSTGQTMTVLDHMAVDTANTDSFRDIVTDETVPQAPPQPVALRVADYSGETAEVTVVMEQYGQHVAVDIRLTWQDGDWLWNTPSESLNVTGLSSLVGYNKISQEEPTNG